MIRVTVELVPFGDDSRAKVLSQVVIYNDGARSAIEGADEWGERVYFVECGHERVSLRHRRGDGADVLVSKAFAALGGAS